MLKSEAFAGGEQQIDEDNARQRARFLAQIPCLTSTDLQRRARHPGGRVIRRASAWKRRGLIFGVPHGGRDLYPTFQFANGRPKPGVRAVLAALPEGMTPWQIAFWWVTGNGWIDCATPAEMFEHDAEAVIYAALRERRDVIG